jgi:hypothetical protein
MEIKDPIQDEYAHDVEAIPHPFGPTGILEVYYDACDRRYSIMKVVDRNYLVNRHNLLEDERQQTTSPPVIKKQLLKTEKDIKRGNRISWENNMNIIRVCHPMIFKNIVEFYGNLFQATFHKRAIATGGEIFFRGQNIGYYTPIATVKIRRTVYLNPQEAMLRGGLASICVDKYHRRCLEKIIDLQTTKYQMFRTLTRLTKLVYENRSTHKKAGATLKMMRDIIFRQVQGCHHLQAWWKKNHMHIWNIAIRCDKMKHAEYATEEEYCALTYYIQKVPKDIMTFESCRYKMFGKQFIVPLCALLQMRAFANFKEAATPDTRMAQDQYILIDQIAAIHSWGSNSLCGERMWQLSGFPMSYSTKTYDIPWLKKRNRERSNRYLI